MVRFIMYTFFQIDNHIDDDGIKVLCDSIEDNKNITTLFLGSIYN